MTRLLLVLLIGIFLSCNNSKSVPRGIIPPDKMEKVLWDMIQTDRFAIQFLSKDSAKINVKEETFKLYEEVFRNHQTNRDEFTKSFKYYMDHPELNQRLYDSMNVRGTRLREDMYKSKSDSTSRPI